MKATIALAAFACLLGEPALAQELPQTLSRWYDALRPPTAPLSAS